MEMSHCDDHRPLFLDVPDSVRETVQDETTDAEVLSRSRPDLPGPGSLGDGLHRTLHFGQELNSEPRMLLLIPVGGCGNLLFRNPM